MAETTNISRMAEKLAGELFCQFGWARLGPTNTNWLCSIQEHEVETHPADVVFTYPHPYLSKNVYLNFDLKSYARGTIQRGTIHAAINKLSSEIECANYSQAWRERFSNEDNPAVDAALFIYNHDAEYDASFADLLGGFDDRHARNLRGRQVYVIGPADVSYMATVANDISVLRGTGGLPPPGEPVHFYYPDLVGLQARSARASVASIETLLGPWIIIRHDRTPSSSAGFIFYYRDPGESVDEFIFLFDMFFRYQMLDDENAIRVCMVSPHVNAAAVFERAKAQYADGSVASSDVAARLARVTYRSVPNAIRRFSEIEIGMGE